MGNKFCIGDKVEFINKEKHIEHPEWFPRPGTIGVVFDISEQAIQIQWLSGTTSSHGCWWTHRKHIMKVKKINIDMDELMSVLGGDEIDI